MKQLISIIIICFFLIDNSLSAQSLEHIWQSPPEEARSWVLWYWMQGAVSKEGITADLEAMEAAGLGGAYLMPVKAVPDPPFITPTVETLSPLWWEMIRFAFQEASRLGLKLGIHSCDGFATAGGPWITERPELSMQKVVWTQTQVQGGKLAKLTLPQPETIAGYYKDIAVYAYPSLPGEGVSTETNLPKVTSSLQDVDAQFLADVNSKETFKSDDPCWIQYAFIKPFTVRTIQVQGSGTNFQAQRLMIEASDDGVNFHPITRLEHPRHGWKNAWQHLIQPMTHSIPPTTARYFRFLYDPAGTEPGSEDLDNAKWKQNLRVRSIRMSSDARIHQFEGKNASAWRVSPRTTEVQIPADLYVDKTRLINISQYMDAAGNLQWNAPEGAWTILRMGHTSTGETNNGGKGSGLECDKFNPEAIRLQFNSWFGKIADTIGEELVADVLKYLHFDSWECGSQNWSPIFRDAFKKRRGYDIYDYLPLYAGVPIENAGISENVLHDVRQTVSELIADAYYTVMREEAAARGCQLSGQTTAPTMVGDGLLHYRFLDVPMGEFWLETPTHDKLNDMLDAISGAHIYGKNRIAAEAFTQYWTTFDEYPGMLKTLKDRNYALGINRMTYHVCVLNPWLDRKPGMTLDGIGLYFQRDQTWWKQVSAFTGYAHRVQAMLQFGDPVVDLAVFTGDELPRRAITPDRLILFLPGIFGAERVEKERIRLENEGTPTNRTRTGITYSANTLRAEDWVNSLRGYAYDSFNPDLLSQMKVTGGKITLPSGMIYQAILVPAKHPMQPNPEAMSQETADRLAELEQQGATFIRFPYEEETFASLGFDRDFTVTENAQNYARNVAYTHRSDGEKDIYFVSNQENRSRELIVSLRVSGKIPELWNPVNGLIQRANNWQMANGRTSLPIRLDAGESVFIVLQHATQKTLENNGENWREYQEITTIASPWTVQFDPLSRGPEQPVVFRALTPWNEHPNDRIRYYSGTAVYSTVFEYDGKKRDGKIFLELDSLYNVASVKINGHDCGTIWTKPYFLNIASAVRWGKNKLEIEVSNTWANRLMGDEVFNAEKDETKKTWTNARHRLTEKKLIPAGLTGKIRIVGLK
ncbi:MAG: discoidin domain-containing protein [Tannerella sp.]|jgi:hypothetical protein|nr:discoidin domain-containing protein [Tannerella sp.]